jgi:hypothetical protein
MNQQKGYYDKDHIRDDLVSVDATWESLSNEARLAFVALIDKRKPIPAELATELRTAKLLNKQDGPDSSALVQNFVKRMLSLLQAKVLTDFNNARFDEFLRRQFESWRLSQPLHEVVEHATKKKSNNFGFFNHESLFGRGLWPEWVGEYCQKGFGKFLTVLEFGPLPKAELKALMPEKLQAIGDALIEKAIRLLGLFEDFDKKTGRILVGLHPLAVAERKNKSKPLETLASQTPVTFGPELGGEFMALRAVLLEIQMQPVRYKQDDTLFVKDEERLQEAIDDLPDDLQEDTHDASNLVSLAASLKCVREETKGAGFERAISPTGAKWLAASIDEQLKVLCRFYWDNRNDSYPYSYSYTDEMFLASNIVSVAPGMVGTATKSRRSVDELKKLSHPLREALWTFFQRLELYTFYRMDDVIAYAQKPERNPLHLGLKPDAATILVQGKRPLPLRDAAEEHVTPLLRKLLEQRLIPLGLVRTGRTADNKKLIARTPWLGLYFGHDMPKEIKRVKHKTQVIVQPDFTVLVVGYDSGPSAELLLFCDRVSGSPSTGSLTLRITKESVARGIVNCLTATELVAKLKEVATVNIPENVLSEVTTWAERVSHVTMGEAILIQCPSKQVADRVLSVVGKKGVRAGDTMVVLPQKIDGLKKRLHAEGVILEKR